MTKTNTDIKKLNAKQINELATTIHNNNKIRGWWDDPDRCLFAVIQLITSEVSEATEGARKGIMDDHLKHREMTEVELADSMVRTLDLGFFLGLSYEPYSANYTDKIDHMMNKIDSEVGRHGVITYAVSMLFTAYFNYKFDNKSSSRNTLEMGYNTLITTIINEAEYQGYDLWAALFEKVEYNTKRADHSRENRAKAGGKKI